MIYVGIVVLFASVLLLACVLTIAIVCDRRDKAKFNERFPPLDDDEFIRRCRPGVNRDIALRVRRSISGALGIEYDRIYPEQSFANDLFYD